MTTSSLQRFTAFSDDPAGGNPAGVWIGGSLPSDDVMQAIAVDVGYSETVFAAKTGGDGFDVRYFSPEREIAFCGHATIALGARLQADFGPGRYILQTAAGVVPIEVKDREGLVYATLTSVEPTTEEAPAALVDAVLDTLAWSRKDIELEMAPAVAAAGARHLLLPVVSRERLAVVDYSFDNLRDLMLAHDLTTVDLFWRESAGVIHSRNLFPVGGVVEDPATGAAAAALAGHLRSIGAISAPAEFVIHQGDDMGRPSLLMVTVPRNGGIEVSGTAIAIDLVEPS